MTYLIQLDTDKNIDVKRFDVREPFRYSFRTVDVYDSEFERCDPAVALELMKSVLGVE